MLRPIFAVAMLAAASWAAAPPSAAATTLNFVGTQYDIGGTFFPGGHLPYVTVPWRTDSDANVYAASIETPNRYYGTAGYALFGTRFDYPDANAFPGFAFEAPENNDNYPNLIDLPSFVSNSQILAERKAGGWAYALIVDPQLMFGIRQWSFDGVNYPPAAEGNATGQNPYVKLGVLDGMDLLGTSPDGQPAGRWGFEVGDGVPAQFRVGVMTDGLDGVQHAPGEVFLYQMEGTSIVSEVSSGSLSRNRFVDMHFFDVVGAQPGDQFIFAAQVAPDGVNAGVAGFSFDVIAESANTADFDGSGAVDGADFLIWQRNLGAAGVGLGQGDANGDSIVNDDDLGVWRAQFGAPGPVAAIPEPTAAALLALGLIGFRRRGAWA